MSFKINKVIAREVLDSRGNPTVEVDVEAGGVLGGATVPSGKSTGKHEALELRDGGKRFHGKGVKKAVRNINKVIGPKLKGIDVTDQREIDEFMINLDGTENKSKLGANAILGVSLACKVTASMALGLNLFENFTENKKFVIPTPFMNIINGGSHADNKLDFQEYMIVPNGKTFKESLQIASEVYQELRKYLEKNNLGSNVGDEGGFAPNLNNFKQPLEILTKITTKLGCKSKVKFALDVAASEFYKKGKYNFEGKLRTSNEMLNIYKNLVKKYPIISIEDPFHEDDFDNFGRLLKMIGDKVNVVGDDLLCTNPRRIRNAIDLEACNCLLLKVNQVGTLSEALAAADLAKQNQWNVMVSHRSGDTEDHFIADMSVGLSNGMIKAGAPCRSERTSKYNQLLRIEEFLGKKSKYKGTQCIRK